MQRGTIKWVTKLLINKKGRGEREGERKFEIDSQRKDQILAFVHALKTNKLFNYVRLVNKHVFFLAKLIFSHFYAN